MLTLLALAVTRRMQRQTGEILARAALVTSSGVLFALQNRQLLIVSGSVTPSMTRLKNWLAVTVTAFGPVCPEDDKLRRRWR
jgi:hypothetical protein